MATVSLVTRNSGGDKDTLYLRVSHGAGTKRLSSLEIKIDPKHWNPNRQKIRKSHPKHADLNRHLLEVLAVAEEAVSNVQTSVGQVTASKIRDEFVRLREGGEEEGEILPYAREFVDGYRRRGQHGTYKSYRTVVNKLEGFMRAEYGRTNVRFEEMKPSFVRSFETHLYEEHDNSRNTVITNLRVLRTITKSAMADGLVTGSDPFVGITIGTRDTTKEGLSVSAIEAIKELDLQNGSTEWYARNYFLFAFYGGGMRYSDVATLRWDHLDGNRIAYKMQKTSVQYSMPILSEAEEILSSYREREGEYRRVFPILDGYSLKEDGSLNSALESTNGVVNRALKTIQKQADLSTHLTFHLARHSLGKYLRDQGWTTSEIQKALGHANIRVTERYLGGFDDDEMDRKWRDAF